EGRPIRVLLADDHTMFRQGLKEMLALDENIEVVGEAENGKEALELVRETLPDVLILDVDMPVMGGQEVLEHLPEIKPMPKVLVVTMSDDPRLVRELLELGASAYLVKSASLEELLATVHAATSPEEPHDENVVLVLPREVLERVEGGADQGLSARELEILLLVARGMSNRRISHALRLSEATVKRHLANLYPKLGVGSRGEATRKALSEGWISARDVTREEDGSPPDNPAPPTTR
ncbi:MAG TPA: response regulator transcription factor, partial [Rubrobacteraceae bacterium]|nr:response regulator transcription factor [Rubrobacteraceae bacterium]